ncbi:MAG: LysM peptidoglycan-binding domain-containing protein [Treponema sp.]|jgi:LysM repeat protein|nr:LysM peptidoglycan-binding domain-containing protein [Treponema sp.]
MKTKINNCLIAIAALSIIFFNCTSGSSSVSRTKGQNDLEDISQFLIRPNGELPVLEFKEIWAYVVAGRENALTPNLPITDIAYFGAEVDAYGKLTAVPRRSALPSHFNGRVHLVIACNGRALTYFTLKPGSPERKAFIADLIAATNSYDGLNIDLEYVTAPGAEAFASFLREVRAGLPRNKMFTLCVPARTRKLSSSDAYDYDKLTPLAERVFVMAYDEHWSGSRPGSVASISWCRNVADYSLRAIGREKLVMGLPFYGRAWGDYSPSRALVYSSIQTIIKDNNITEIRYENGVPTFSYNKNVTVRLYYEDEYSLVSRMQMYKLMGVDGIGFWRLGQETTDIWKYLKISTGTTARPAPAAQTASRPAPQTTAVAPAPATTPATSPAAPATPAAAPDGFSGRYTVRSGDSLWTISRRYGITPQALADANNMRLNDTLRIGRVLRVPAQ